MVVTFGDCANLTSDTGGATLTEANELSATPTRSASSSSFTSFETENVGKQRQPVPDFLETLTERLSCRTPRAARALCFPTQSERADMRVIFDMLILKGCGSTGSCNTPKARLGRAAFQMAIGSGWNAPLVHRLFDILDLQRRGSLSCEDFTTGLLPLYSPHMLLDGKMRFLFDCFDLDGDGEISRDECAVMLTCLLGSGAVGLSREQMGWVIDTTFRDIASVEGANITRADFEAHFATRPAAQHAPLASAGLDLVELTISLWLSIGSQWLDTWRRPTSGMESARGERPTWAVTLLGAGS